jgi:carbon storage regulator
MVEVSILAISRDKVKLGFTAPRMISVHRKEVYDLIQKENEAASRETKVDLDDLLTLLKKD